jgi:hypothetical protein
MTDLREQIETIVHKGSIGYRQTLATTDAIMALIGWMDAKGVEDAIAECQRYLDYLDAAKRRSRQIQEIAGQARRGEITRDEARRMADKASGPGVVVYDGAKLADAIKTLMVAAASEPDAPSQASDEREGK